MRNVIKNDDFADDVANVAANPNLDAAEARQLVRTAVAQRYTAPASPG